jgi:hypothetical protein
MAAERRARFLFSGVRGRVILRSWAVEEILRDRECSLGVYALRRCR